MSLDLSTPPRRALTRAAGGLALGSLIAFAAPARSEEGAPREPAATEAALSTEAELDAIAAASLALFAEHGPRKQEAIDALLARADPSLIPTFVLAMRWTGEDRRVARALSELTGAEIATWHDAFEWQEAHPEIVPHPTFRPLKLRFLSNTDAGFGAFFEGVPRERMRVRLEEVVWGGVRVDEIPSLDAPTMIPAAEAAYLLDGDLVFGIEINGDARAYPLRILGWHEMMNDVVGGVPVALTYCTLCGAGVLYETRVEGRAEPFIFATSGLLHRSNKLMFDRETRSLWSQFDGEPVVGPLVDSGIALRRLPIVITRWDDWRARRPETTVLSLETGYVRDYGSGVAYQEYFASAELMFPSTGGTEALRRKDAIYGVRTTGAARAWPIAAVAEEGVINDRIGLTPVVVLAAGGGAGARVYERGARRFEAGPDAATLRDAQGGLWRVEEAGLIGPEGVRAPRLAGHASFWFAWNNRLGAAATLYPDPP